MSLSEPLPFFAIVSAVAFFLVVLGVGVIFVKNHPKADKENRK